MAEIAISVAAKVAEYLVAPIARPFRYLWKYKSNVENLETEVKKLKGRRDSVQCLVEVAGRNGEETLPHVKIWQDKANQVIDEASEVVEDNPEQANMSCFKGFSSPNLMKRYRRSKNAAGKLKDAVVGLEQEAVEFKEVSYRTIPEQTCLQPSQGHEDFASRKSILKDIIAVLRNPGANMVGIYGMGGVGKTTLVKEVAAQAKQDKLFDKIVFVEVSVSPDIKNIQGVIADYLGLHFIEETISGRASRLCVQLKKQKILLILDNIWGRIDLEAIGIPFGNDSKGLKLLLTTRSSHVLTNEMDSQCNFYVEALNEADAWSLFKSIAGTCTEQPHLKFVAPEVVKECGGMPIAIVTIARALKNKEECEWRKVLRELKNPSWERFEGITKEVYSSIQLSYNYLDTAELKEIFLLCSRMGRTYDASIRDLFRYGWGLGLFERFNTIEEALCNVYALVNTLKATSLLLDAPNKTEESAIYGIPDSEKFAMHDVVCVVARSIASRDQNVFTVIDDVIPRSWAKEDTLRNCTSITLHNINELPKDLVFVCPQLKFLYVKLKDSFTRIPDNFFTRMLGLQSLHLIEMDLRPVPTSLSCLVNLQTLCLDHCKLGDMVVIGKLEKLEIVSFRHSQIKKLSEQMHRLTRLRLFDLSNCSKLCVIHPIVMSNFTQLEALYMGGTSIKWEVDRSNTERPSASIGELKNLCNLTTLEIQIPDAKMSKGLLFPKLERYKIFIGENWRKWEWEIHSKTSRMLKLKIATNEDGIISQLKGIGELELCEVQGVRNVFYDLDRKGFPELKHLRARNNSQLLCIVDSKQSCDALTILESLVLSSLINLKKICNNPLGAESFRQLRTIEVQYCHELNNIFSFSTDTALPQLQEIRVSYCQNVEQIFAIGGQDGVNNTEAVDKIQFSQLRVLTLEYLPQLKSFCSKVKTTFPLQLTSDTKAKEIISEDELDITMPLFNEKVMFPNLEILEISEVNFGRIWHNQLPMMSSCVRSLTRLIIGGCDNLKELFLSSMVNSFVQLQYLKLYACSVLEEMVVTEELREEERRDAIPFPQFPSLQEIKIEKCPRMELFIFSDKVAFPKLETLEISKINVEKIWHNQLPTMSSCVQNLTRLIVQGCANLEYLFSCSMVNSLLQLQYLEIYFCPVLKNIVVTEELREEGRDTVAFPQFPSLKEMKIERCPKLEEFIFDDKVGFPSLEKVKIMEMDNLKMIWHNQLAEDFFCKLNSLEVYNCRELLTVLPSNMCGRLLRLEFLLVVSCDFVEEIFDLQGINFEERHSTPATQLRELRIHDLPKLKHIWNKDPQRLLSFGNLQGLEVSECWSLKNLFPESVARDLSELVYLSVADCGVEEIVAKEGVVVEEMPPRFLFPELTFLKLHELPKLSNFYPGRHTVEGPVLKSLHLQACGKLMIFTPEVLNIHDTDEEGQLDIPMQQPLFEDEEDFPCLGLEELKLVGKNATMMGEFHDTHDDGGQLDIPMQQPLFEDEEAFPCLEELKLVGENATMMWEGQIPESLFHTLKILEVQNDKSTVLPLDIIQRFHNLKKLLLDGGSYEEIFSYQEIQKQVGTLAKMKELDHDGLDGLKYMRIQSGLNLVLQNLEVLEVMGCVSLINLNLTLSSASFQNLTALKVNRCKSLTDMVISSTAKSLVQLIEMSIWNCEKIIEVVGDQGDVTDNKIIFCKLKSLSLYDLPNLTSFCFGNFSLEFPSLEELIVNNCPKMKIFSRRVLSTQMLREVEIDRESVELSPNLNLNEAIQQFHEKARSRGLR
ncbi:hypothetical protein ACOSQ3_021228 [Xanthoceras sorbifolium]